MTNTSLQQMADDIIQSFFERGARVSSIDHKYVLQMLHEAQEDMRTRCFKLIEQHDPSTGRATTPVYWGNTLRAAIEALADTTN